MQGETIKIDRLKGSENWAPWKFQLKVILKSHDAWDVVIGDVKKPDVVPADATQEQKKDYDEKLAKWKKLDNLAQKLIVTNIEQQPLLLIMNSEYSYEMWSKLEAIYEQKCEAGIHMLQQEFHELKKDKNEDIATYISKVENIAHRLKIMGEAVSDTSIITKILLTLPPIFQHFNSAWESTAKADRRNVNLTYRLIMEEKRVTFRDKEEDNAFLSRREHHQRSNINMRNRQTKQGACFICKKEGHWKNECWFNPENKKEERDSTKTKIRGEALILEILALKPMDVKPSENEHGIWIPEQVSI